MAACLPVLLMFGIGVVAYGGAYGLAYGGILIVGCIWADRKLNQQAR